MGVLKPGYSGLPFSEDRRQKYLILLQETGEVAYARHEVGVSKAVVDAARRKDPSFGEREEEALRLYRAAIGREIHRRAMVGVDEPIYYCGVVVGHKKSYSDRLLLAHARRHEPEYRDKIQVDQNVSGGVTLIPDLSSLSPESRAEFRRIAEREKSRLKITVEKPDLEAQQD